MRPSYPAGEWQFDEYALRAHRSPEYWNETRRPLVCLVFLAPLLAIYEIGVIYFGGRQPEQIRNGADSWMRCWLSESAGCDGFLPVFVLSGLLLWHLLSRQSWRVDLETPMGMFAESLLFAFALLFVGQLTDTAFQRIGVPAALSVPARKWQATAITFVGAGIYEEFLFRLCLLPACIGGLRVMRLGNAWAVSIAVLVTSLAFSLAHYVGPAAEQFDLFTFTFRSIAGVFFAVLFLTRGFGIAVGSHAAYDLIVGVLMFAQG